MSPIAFSTGRSGPAEDVSPVARHLLIDGNSLTYRAFFALPEDMATSTGQPTNAVFGLVSMLVNVLRDQQPDGVLVAFDRPEPTFRHEAEPEYKAQRESTPDTLRQQLPVVREVLAAAGIHQVEASGWEADDLIATAADRLAARGDDVIIVTGDRDSYQLVRDPHIRVLYNKRGVSDYALYDEAGILERTGVTPALYPQYAALRGDPSDNLPGVPGVGEKTAAKLINAHGGLDGIFAALDAQTPKLRENLAANEDRARRNHDLMLLRTDAPVGDLSPEVLALTPDGGELRRLFGVLEFSQLLGRLEGVLGDLGGEAPASAEPAPTVEAISAVVVRLDDPEVIAERIGALEVLHLAADFESDPGRSPVTGLAVVADEPTGEVLWFDASVLGHPSVSSALSSHRRLRMHRAKDVMRSLLPVGVDLQGLELDLAIAAYLVDPVVGDYEITDLVERFTDMTVGARASVPEGQLDLGGADDDRAQSTADSALAIARCAGPISDAVVAVGAGGLLDEIETPLVRVLARMEHLGIEVDVDALRAIGDRLRAEVDELAARLREEAGHPDLNLNSPTQLRQLLYEERGLSPAGVRKTKSGYSTDAQTLEKLREQWPEFIEPLLRHREVDKLRGTYGEGLLAEVAADGRIHATFHQTVARTGRLSSDRPNLHNIPVRTEEGRVFRTAFRPTDGHRLLVADYNQIELRCIAHLAADPGLIAAFTAGEDIHRATAARVFEVDPGDVTVDQRSKAKMVSYGLAYGMEAYGLGQRLAIPTDEAAGILAAYFEAFPNVREYMDTTVAEARTNGFTETLFGRRRPVPELLDSNWRVRQAGERQAMNAGIQGLAADIFKVALVRIDDALDSAGHSARLVLQVHDEVLVEVPEDECDAVGPLVIELMRGAASLDVPLEVNVAWGDTWAAAKS
ncbi:MAG: DNA polymerase I [Ilumatobacteraceae bacterium]